MKRLPDPLQFCMVTDNERVCVRISGLPDPVRYSGIVSAGQLKDLKTALPNERHQAGSREIIEVLRHGIQREVLCAVHSRYIDDEQAARFQESSHFLQGCDRVRHVFQDMP